MKLHFQKHLIFSFKGLSKIYDIMNNIDFIFLCQISSSSIRLKGEKWRVKDEGWRVKDED
jgi:hypothetical protein